MSSVASDTSPISSLEASERPVTLSLSLSHVTPYQLQTPSELSRHPVEFVHPCPSVELYRASSPINWTSTYDEANAVVGHKHPAIAAVRHNVRITQLDHGARSTSMAHNGVFSVSLSSAHLTRPTVSLSRGLQRIHHVFDRKVVLCCMICMSEIRKDTNRAAS